MILSHHPLEFPEGIFLSEEFGIQRAFPDIELSAFIETDGRRCNVRVPVVLDDLGGDAVEDGDGTVRCAEVDAKVDGGSIH